VAVGTSHQQDSNLDHQWSTRSARGEISAGSKISSFQQDHLVVLARFPPELGSNCFVYGVFFSLQKAW
jgi:hypothetical protein